MYRRRPDETAIGGFLRHQAGQPFSYPEPGATRGDPPVGFDLDHNRERLGRGAAAFQAACAAIRDWRMFPAGWTAIFPGQGDPRTFSHGGAADGL
ncbi:MAG: hypothetical protein A3G75_07145 [Verrucomicrobia bacterium RIFCSPLOWO2_12_FULL_64_8]|nr:MAG: hypothetical protein A3G75_07145 [Verrucomicrobia bacterium RIFCSPLOWO2_12_FULL_64_8]